MPLIAACSDSSNFRTSDIPSVALRNNNHSHSTWMRFFISPNSLTIGASSWILSRYRPSTADTAVNWSRLFMSMIWTSWCDYPTSAHERISLVEGCELTLRYCSLRSLELNQQFSVSRPKQLTCLIRLSIAYFCLKFARELWGYQPIHVWYAQPGLHQILFVLTNHKGVALHYFFHDVPGNFWSTFKSSNVDTFPLPYCVKMQTIVRSKANATAVSY